MKGKFSITVFTLVAFFTFASESSGWNQSPHAMLESDMQVGVGLDGVTVTFDGSNSYDPDGWIAKYQWDFDYDGSNFTVDYEEPGPGDDGVFDGITTYTYTSTGSYSIKMRVTDNNNNVTESTAITYYQAEGIQDAIDNADESDPRPVVVMPGIYKGDTNTNLHFYDKSITLRSADPSDPSVVANTIIDCEEASERSAFWFRPDDNNQSVIDGFTMRNAHPGDDCEGGGVYCQWLSSPTIAHCVIIDNKAKNGGGIAFTGSGAPVIEKCIFRNNEACGLYGGRGGAVYVGDNSSANIIDSTFLCNKAERGGGIDLNQCTANVTGCIFVRNEATYATSENEGGGGIHIEGSETSTSEITITDCVFRNNKARNSGGGICNVVYASPQISGCVFLENYASQEYGGGIQNYDHSSPQITNSVFIKNLAMNHCGGGIQNNFYCAPEVKNCVFFRNSSNGVGGMCNEHYSCPEVINCTFTENSGDLAAGMHNKTQSNPSVTNCIFWDELTTPYAQEIFDEESSFPNVTYCCIQNGYSRGNQIIDDEPLFVTTLGYVSEGLDGLFRTWDDGLALCFDSPCIDAGIDVVGLPTEDITGRNRKMDGNHDGVPKVDMGAYELPRIWFVKNNAQGNNTGITWQSAFLSLDSGINAANSDDEIWVASGTSPYKPSVMTNPPNSRSSTFQLCNDKLYGGFEGTELARCQRDWVMNETTLSGDIGYTGNQSDNSYHVITITGLTVLDGFTVMKGNGNTSWPNDRGGGIYCSNANWPIMIANCTITGNSAKYGAGASCYSASPEFTNCTLSNNLANYDGGGLWSYYGNPVLTDCKFIGNSANNYGAGMITFCNGPTLTNCTFNGNYGPTYGGGGLFIYHCNPNYGIPVLTNCVFSGNSAAYGGGTRNFHSTSAFINCTYSGNLAGHGGGIYIDQSNFSPRLVDCILWGNTAEELVDSGASSVTYSDIEGDWPGEGNINVEPLFVEDLHLGFGSPCIDSGNNKEVTIITDKEGNARKVNDIYKQDTGKGTSPLVDMGAYEHIWWSPVGAKICGGEFHTLLAKANGTVWACGDNTYYGICGQLGIGDNWDVFETSELLQVWDGGMQTKSAYIENIVLLDAGFKHSLSVDQDGYVWAWGMNDYGQLGDGGNRIDPRTVPVRVLKGEKDQSNPAVQFLTGIIKVAAGRCGLYSLALDMDKCVWAWGNNYYGQLGNGKSFSLDSYSWDEWFEDTPRQVLVQEGIIDIDAGICHSIAADEHGQVWCWGDGAYGKLGQGSGDVGEHPTPVRVLGENGQNYLQNIADVAVCCGMEGFLYVDAGASYAVNSQHQVWAWGNADFGKLGQGDADLNHHYTPVKVKGENGVGVLENIIAISAGNHHVLALDNQEKVWAWGKNYYGQLGNGKDWRDYLSTLEYEAQPVQVMRDQTTPLTNIVYIDAGFEHSLAIDNDGNIWVWGRNSYYELGLGDPWNRLYATLLE